MELDQPVRVALVTGAAQGIGECVAINLAQQGYSVAAADIQAERVQEVAASLTEGGHRASGFHVDVADRASVGEMVEEVLEQFGRVDGLINCGGLDAQLALPLEIDEEHWRRFIDVDLTGQWWCTQAVLPSMIENRFGRVVYISSTGVYTGLTEVSVAYAAAKAGLIGLTVMLSAQVEADGILVNSLMVGPTGNTGTPMDEEGAARYMETYPLGFGTAQPVADAVSFLLGSSGDWISGAILNVSGGRVRGR